MIALVPPFYTSNILSLASKICEGDYDHNPMKSYSDCIRKIVIGCLTVDPNNRPDIYGISQLCIEQLMLYTDRSCGIIQSHEKSLRQRDTQRELSFRKQQSQLQHQLSNHQHQRCLSCSSAKESLVNSSGGIPDVCFEGIDLQHENSKQETFSMSK